MRPSILNPSFREIETIKGVGPGIKRALTALKLYRVKDIIYHFPNKWMYRHKIANLDEAQLGQIIILKIQITEHKSSSSQRSPTRIIGLDAAGNALSLIFFGRNGGYARKQFPLETQIYVSGKLEQYGDEWQIIHPEIRTENNDNNAEKDKIIIEPVYALSAGLTQHKMGNIVKQCNEDLPKFDEWIEPSLKNKFQWPNWHDAILSVHKGPDETARNRLAYDEIFSNQLALRLIRQSMDRRAAIKINRTGHLIDKLKLPFNLTNAQQRALSEIEENLQQSTPMLRLLQGDVGAGKTMVAVMTMLFGIENGHQCALLAPTEILARQHFATLSVMLGKIGVNVAILTSREKGKVRESTLMGLANGEIDILVGTHAIFQEKVIYKNLAIAIIDEQHRFGVAQRLMLSNKAVGTPHLLVMTATPIPRTLALASYGEMDVSVLDELPPGRTPVDTRIASSDRMDEIYAGLRRHIEEGKQGFWVCPLVEESELSHMTSAEERAASLRQVFGDKIGIVHGRMKGPEKEEVMRRFIDREFAILVATTVIEVGVDVPNASLMIIEHAENFGLAQLHQLRGRVGRGAEKSSCLLIRNPQISEIAKTRLKLMRSTNDGFIIAEEDLKQRGPGEILGTRQSGDSPFNIATAEQLSEYLPIANDDAKLLLQRDGGLKGPRGEAARILLYLMERDAGVELLRSG
ncbi:ATP-dependent DNA helicase RecG [Sphingorhabdus lutea]|uniref:ATP-dependent DNA helicase RecG n=1 Tax=Sphingorhabdus lutea TaxID=1913578 RepID=A0A1L3JCA0_9SPHN|nr:ATP-dependent DNA helicase RecG [Sphingorhabdus lutea]APG62756.1 ATP-dependent DNA helicase RecG [Sphingorhabdus lutea]